MKFRIHSLLVVLLTAVLCGLVFAAPNEPLDRARERAHRGNWEEVLSLAQEATNVDPKSDDAWRLWARASLFLGDTATSIAKYESALALNPKQAESVVDLTTLYVSMNRLDDADRVVSAAEAKDKKGKLDEIKAARALILGKQGKIAEATPILASATAKNPDNPLYPLMLARIYRNANVTALAADNFEKAWSLNEGDPDIAFEYGQTLLELKKYDEADKLFKIVQERDPENQQVDFLRGRLRYAARRYAEASAEFQKAVEKDADNFLANYWLGRSFVDLSKAEKKNFYSAAVSPLRRALSQKPDRNDIRLSLSEAEYFVGRSLFYTSQQDSLSADSRERMASEFESQSKEYEKLASGSISMPTPPAPPAPPGEGEVEVPEVPPVPPVTEIELKGLYAQIAARYKAAAAVLRAPGAVLDDKHPLRGELLGLSTVLMEAAILNAPELARQQDAYANIARAFDKLGALDSSLVYTDLQLQMTPESNSDVTRKVSLLQRLDDQARLGEYLNELTADDAALDKYGLILVNSYIETKQYDKAREAATKVIARDPSNCDAHQLNAYIDLKRERYGSAITALLAGVKACPNNKDLWVFLGDSYYFSNENDKPTVQKAKDAYQRACDLGDRTGCEKAEQIDQILRQMRR
ncbi:MAG: tetratricopeptide repeat protein [Calditrichaeota bacterium]|nr:tetratricopeptide repeat protein [Calditrichota bacterium]